MNACEILVTKIHDMHDTRTRKHNRKLANTQKAKRRPEEKKLRNYLGVNIWTESRIYHPSLTVLLHLLLQ